MGEEECVFTTFEGINGATPDIFLRAWNLMLKIESKSLKNRCADKGFLQKLGL